MTLWTVGVLGFLYFLQGMPYGIQTKFLPIILRTHGVSLTYIALFKLLFLPYVLKLLWAPFVDRHGTRKQWLIVTLLMLCIACILTAMIDFSNLVMLAMMLFLMNMCVSVQDISVDAVAVAALAAEDVGLGNVAQVVGYKLGGVVGGGSYMMLQKTFGNGVVYLTMALFYAAALGAVARLDISSMHLSNIQKTKSPSSSTEPSKTFLTHKKAISDALQVTGSWWMIAYTVLYKCGENGSISMLPLYLIDVGASDTQVAFYTGIIGLATSIVGSMLGGAILKKYSVSESSYYLNILRLIVMSSVVIIVNLHTYIPLVILRYKNDILLILCCMQLFLSGVSSILTFSWMMHLSQNAPSDIQLTHYTMLSTTEVLGKLLFASILGKLADVLGYQQTFTVLLVMMAVVTAMTAMQPDRIKTLGSQLESSAKQKTINKNKS